jgi:hypothetical protein
MFYNNSLRIENRENHEKLMSARSLHATATSPILKRELKEDLHSPYSFILA